MGHKQKKIDDFKIGDFISFDKKFSLSEFEAFSKISGDQNPLHHNEDYGKASEFGQTIVPVHMTSAPLSAIAGMYLPGIPSLYLRHEVNALKPVYYDESLTYSAKISDISYASRLLKLSVIAFNPKTLEVKLEANMSVQSREDSWEFLYEENSAIRTPQKTALITGASGEIASAIAMHYARKGWGVILSYRTENDRVKRVKDYCTEKGLFFDVITGDLADEKTYVSIAKEVNSCGGLYRIIHAACPPIYAKASQHLDINFTALKRLSDALIPHFLQQQTGGIVLIGSTATENCPAGWEPYAAGKSAGMNLLKQYRKRYGKYGVEFKTFSPGMVKTKFSSDYHDARVHAALPEEVAAKLFETIEGGLQNDHIIYENAELYFSGHETDLSTNVSVTSVDNVYQNESLDELVVESAIKRSDVSEKLTKVMGPLLKLNSVEDIRSSRLGGTPGWDSLRHIELILDIERAFGVRFSSSEMSRTHSFKALEAKVSEKCRTA